MEGSGETRREFLKRAAILGLGITAGTFLPVTSEAVRFDKENHKVTRTRLLIGTLVTITVVDRSRERADDAISAALNEIERLEGIFSRFKSTSPVGLLNQEGEIRDIPLELDLVLKRSLEYFRVTKGAFDITVKPVLDLFQDRSQKGQSPSEKDLEGVMAYVGSENLEITHGRVLFKKEKMGITLDGIAKGFIVDMAAKAMDQKGVKNYLINAGGDIRVKGERRGGGPWRIGIQDPRGKKETLQVVQLSTGSIATSGDYEVFFDREKVFHHIVDPQRGISPLELSSVTVFAKDTTEADALSTALFVMGPKKALEFASNFGCECLLVDKNAKNLFSSKGWAQIKKA